MAIKYTKWPKIFQMAIKYTKWPKIFQMSTKHTNIIHPKALEIIPKFGIFWKENTPSGNPDLRPELIL
jgi:hypothetical protein